MAGSSSGWLAERVWQAQRRVGSGAGVIEEIDLERRRVVSRTKDEIGNGPEYGSCTGLDAARGFGWYCGPM